MDSKPREEKDEDERNREAKKEQERILPDFEIHLGRQGKKEIHLGPHSPTSLDQEQFGQWSIS